MRKGWIRNIDFKTANSTKNRALMNYVYWKALHQIKERIKAKNEVIREKEKATWEELEKIKDLTEQEKQAIVNKIIKELPPETQVYIKKINKEFSPIKETSKLKEWFKELGIEMSDAGILKYMKDNYMHWHISTKILKKYIKAKWLKEKELLDKYSKKTIEQLEKEAKTWKSELTPEQIAWILKESKDVYYLHSHNPLDILTSYTNELAKFKQQKDIVDFTNKLIEKVWLWTAGLLSRELYIGNTPMTIQNILFGSTQFWTQLWKWLLTGKIKLSKDNQIWEVRKYLVENGEIAHKDYNIDSTSKWNVKLSTKIRDNTKHLDRKLMRIFTATWVQQMQSLFASWFMQKVISKYEWWLKEWESIVKQFEETLSKLPKEQSILLRWEMAKWIKRIEDSTYSNTATSKYLNVPLFNMIKSFSRQNLAHMKNDVWDIMDAIKDVSKEVESKKNKATTAFEWWEKSTRLWKFASYVFAENMQDYLLNTLKQPLWAAWLDVLSW